MASKQGDKPTSPETKTSGKDPKGPDGVETSNSGESPAQEIITAFGGLRPLANRLGIAVSTVQGWKERDSIPAARHEEILQAAVKANVKLDVARVRESDQLNNETEDQTSTTSEKKADGKEPTAKNVTGSGETQSGSESNKNGGSVPVSGGKPLIGKEPEVVGKTAKDDLPSGKKIDFEDSVSQTKNSGSTHAPRRNGGMNSFLFGVGTCALVLAAVVYTRGYWLPIVERLPVIGASENQISLEGLEERIVGLEQHALSDQGQGVNENRFLSLSEQVRTLKLAQSELERQLSSLTDGGVVVTTANVDRGLMDSLRKELTETRSRLQRLEQSGGQGNSGSIASFDPLQASRLEALQAEVEALSSRFNNLGAGQSARPGPATNDVYLALAVLQLRDALRGSGPFIRELDLVRAVSSENATLQDLVTPLSSFASEGLPSMTELRADFPAAARSALSADKVAGGQTWVDKALGRISNVISIRPVDVLDGQGTASVLARAENYLLEGDLTGAVRELEGLTSAARSGMENWLLQAGHRLEGERVSGKLALLLIGVTEQGSGTGGAQ
ncbi:carph-isopro domain-containing protein [Kiloniella laminariae]|uniref:carph-isopro domain-containing protein n=1 Tax=Kiloniella laminariae TaxID=454162 RepID=UPI00035CB160|nr:mitofilin family membrane protein [Kiloniella laminariae]